MFSSPAITIQQKRRILRFTQPLFPPSLSTKTPTQIHRYKPSNNYPNTKATILIGDIHRLNFSSMTTEDAIHIASPCFAWGQATDNHWLTLRFDSSRLSITVTPVRPSPRRSHTSQFDATFILWFTPNE